MAKTVAQIIAYVDSIKSNEFTAEVKTYWLNEVEGMVQTGIMGRKPGDANFVLYSTEPADQLKQVLVAPPHDAFYAYYLMAQIDFSYEEYSKFQNTMQMFNAAWEDYTKWHQRTYGHLCRNSSIAL